VVIATVFLTIIGMTAGYALGERHRRDNQASGSTPASSGTFSSPTPDPAPTGPPCPPEASEIAAKLGLPTQLTQVFKIETDKGTTVWICEDPDRNLYYQSKTGGLDGKLVQGKNGLFLTEVTQQSDADYEARATNGNVIEVNSRTLQVRFTTGKVQTDTVLHSY
jgi:hypothetical protein